MKPRKKKQKRDKERLADIKRKTTVSAAAAAVILLTLILCFVLSRLSVGNVDTKKGVAAIQELERTDTSVVEARLRQIKEAEQKALEEWMARPLTEKFAGSLVMGDNLTEGFSDYEVLEETSLLYESGASLANMDEMIASVEAAKPKALFLALGRNDVLRLGGDRNTFIEQYRALIGALRERVPETKLYVNLILPVQKEEEKETPEYGNIPDYNKALKAMCKEESITVIDDASLVTDEYFEPDGEHMKASFYPVWAELMAEVSKI